MLRKFLWCLFIVAGCSSAFLRSAEASQLDRLFNELFHCNNEQECLAIEERIAPVLLDNIDLPSALERPIEMSMMEVKVYPAFSERNGKELAVLYDYDAVYYAAIVILDLGQGKHYFQKLEEGRIMQDIKFADMNRDGVNEVVITGLTSGMGVNENWEIIYQQSLTANKDVLFNLFKNPKQR